MLLCEPPPSKKVVLELTMQSINAIQISEPVYINVYIYTSYIRDIYISLYCITQRVKVLATQGRICAPH